jgi:hypothetical protein
LQRTILADLPKQIRHLYPQGSIMMVVKPLYGIAEASAHWWLTYFKYYCEKLIMEVSTYNPCLLIILASFECFGMMGMQTNDTLGLNDDAFAIKEFQKLVFTAKKKQFLTFNNPLFFNECVFTVNRNTLRIWQKNQGQKLEKATDAISYVQQRARGAYIATICQPKASFDLSAAAQIINPSKKDIAKLNG